MRYYGVFLLLVLLAPAVSAELLFSQPASVYNKGDVLNMSLLVRSQSATNAFLTVTLVCDGHSVELYRNVVNLPAGGSYELPLTTRLESPVAQEIGGTCELVARFSDEETNSPSFTLSNHITVETALSAALVNPAAVMRISGNARKENGQLVNGFVHASWDEHNLSITGIVTNGVFSLNLTLPPLSQPGHHTLTIEVYERNNRGEVINQGERVEDVQVRAVLSRVELVLDQNEALPGTSLRYTFLAYDQVGNALSRDARYDVYDPTGARVQTRLAKTSVGEVLNIPSNVTPGYWKIDGAIGELSIRKLFYMNERELVSFDIENETLTVANLGNVPYKHSLNINIGNYSVLKDIELALGQVKRYKLRAPEDDYDIHISDGATTFSALGVPLTGRAIDIGEIGTSFFNLWWVGGFILGVCVLLGGVHVYRTHRGSLGYTTNGGSSSLSRGAASLVGLSKTPAQAYGAGAREQATIIAIKTPQEAHIQTALSNALTNAQKAGVTVSRDATHHVLVFSPRFTKKLDNDLFAVQTAQEIAAALAQNSGNDKPVLGIAVGTGTIISDATRKGSFTSIGASIPATKRLASAARGEVLLSEELHARLRTSIRAERVASLNAWRVNEVINREQHKSFIDGFLKRYNR